MLAGNKESGKSPNSKSTLEKSDFVTREPISIFSGIKNAKNEEEKKKLNQLLETLRKKLPEGFKIGAAIGEGDCFFDSIAQGLNELKDKGLITGSQGFSVKSLRESCKQYAQQVNQEKGSWLDNALKREGEKLCEYIPRIKFTAEDIEGANSDSEIKVLKLENAIWGRSEIEGKMICEKYSVKIRIIELRDKEIDGVHVTKGKVGTGNNIIYIVNYRNHFVPLLSNIQQDIEKNQNVNREEVYGIKSKGVMRIATNKRLKRVNLDSFTTLLEKRITRSADDIDKVFGTQEKVDRLSRVNLDLFNTLLEKGIIHSADDIDEVFGTQEKVDRLSNVELDLLQILIDRNSIQGSANLSGLLHDEDFIINARNNPSLTRMLLNIDGIANSVISLIKHPKYTESSDHLIRNCKLALALLKKGAIENVTIDYLFDSEKIKNDLKGNEFVKNTVVVNLFDKDPEGNQFLKETEIYYPFGNDLKGDEFFKNSEFVSDDTQRALTADNMLDDVFARSGNNVENNPMPKLKDLSLEAFVKAIIIS